MNLNLYEINFLIDSVEINANIKDFSKEEWKMIKHLREKLINDREIKLAHRQTQARWQKFNEGDKEAKTPDEFRIET